MQDARTWAAGILLPFAHFGDQFIAHGRAIAARNEETRISFEVLMGSVEEANKMMNRLIDYAAHTPFELPQLFNVTQGLVAFGDRGDNVMETLKMLGDVSGGVHEKFQILGTVFNQIRGVGSLLSQDFKQLSIRGMLFITDLAEYLQVSKEQADHLQRTGQVSFEDVKNTLMMLTTEGHRFHNMMERQSQSIHGLTATLKDNWGIFASKVAEALIPIDRVILKIKIQLVDALSGLVDATHGFTAGAILGAIAASKFALAMLTAAVAARILRISLGAIFKGGLIAGAVIAVGAALGGLVNWFLHTAEGERTVTEVSKNLAKAWLHLKEAAYELYTSLQEGILNAFGVTLPDVMNMSAKSFADAIIRMSEWLLYLAEMVKFVAGGIGSVFRNAWDLLAIGGIDMMIGLIDIIHSLEESFASLATYIMKTFSGIVAFIGAVFTNALNRIEEFIQKLKEMWIYLQGGVKIMSEGLSPQQAAEWATEEVKKSRKKFEDNKNPDKNPNDEYDRGFKEGPDAFAGREFEEMKKALEEEKKLLQDRINERENRRKEPPKPGELPPDEEKKKKRERSNAPLIDPGRYGFIEFGRKIQDAMLKNQQGDQQQRMIDLLGQGNVLQERLLELARGNGGLGP